MAFQACPAPVTFSWLIRKLIRADKNSERSTDLLVCRSNRIKNQSTRATFMRHPFLIVFACQLAAIVASQILVAPHCHAQGRQPPVSALFQQHDQNKDQALTADEVEGTRYQRQFPRWDADRDGKVSAQEIISISTQVWYRRGRYHACAARG